MPAKKQKTLLATNFRFLREERGFTTNQLADAVGVSNPAIRDIESGKVASPGAFLLARVARLFHVSVQQLISEEIKVICPRERAIAYALSDFDDADWENFIDNVEVKWRKKVHGGYYENLFEEFK